MVVVVVIVSAVGIAFIVLHVSMIALVRVRACMHVGMSLSTLKCLGLRIFGMPIIAAASILLT